MPLVIATAWAKVPKALHRTVTAPAEYRAVIPDRALVISVANGATVLRGYTFESGSFRVRGLRTGFDTLQQAALLLPVAARFALNLWHNITR
jgi:hypothetical protein